MWGWGGGVGEGVGGGGGGGGLSLQNNTNTINYTTEAFVSKLHMHKICGKNHLERLFLKHFLKGPECQPLCDYGGDRSLFLMPLTKCKKCLLWRASVYAGGRSDNSHG